MVTGLAVFLVLLVGVLAIPLTLTFRFSLGDARPNDFRFRWAFGLVDARARPGGRPASKSKAKRRRRTDRRDTSRRRGWNVIAALRRGDFRARIVKFTKDFWRAIHKEDLRLRLRVGLGDPADTGQLWSVLGPVSGMLSNVRQASIQVEPDFVDATLQVDSSGSVRIVPLQLLYLTTAVLLSPSVWRGLRRMRTEGS